MSKKTSLELLKEGLFIKEMDTQSDEPHHYVLDIISPTVMLSSWRSEYAGEMERVLKELKLTINLINNINEQSTNARELILYYQGIFLHLTHQMKEKLFGLIKLITEDDQQGDPIKDKDITLKELLAKEIVKDINLIDLLKEWSQETGRPIGVTLDKRTTYHHRRSSLHLNKDLQNFDFAKIMLKQEGFKLTDEGVKRFQKLEKEGFSKWKKDIIQKTLNTYSAVEKNLNEIAEKLIEYFKIPTTIADKAKVIRKQQAMHDSFEIKNNTSISSLPKGFLDKIDKIVNESRLKEIMESIYIVGSLPRGDFHSNWSDINMYFVLKNDEVKNEQIEVSKLDVIPKLKAQIFSTGQFMSDNRKAKKARFICWADGILIYGKDLIKEEKFPKAGMDLALLLNYDLYEDIAGYGKWVEENKSASSKEIGAKSKEIAKRIVDFIYGIAITNKPSYTSNRIERLKHIDECFPENSNSIYIYQQLLSSTYGVKTMDEIGYLIDELKNKSKNLDKMINERSEIDKKREKRK